MQTTNNFGSAFSEQSSGTACAISAKQPHCSDDKDLFIGKALFILNNKVLHNFRRIAEINGIAQNKRIMFRKLRKTIGGFNGNSRAVLIALLHKGFDTMLCVPCPTKI